MVKDRIGAVVRSKRFSLAARLFKVGFVLLELALVAGSYVLAFLVLFGWGWGFFDSNNMPILCQIARPHLRATGYGFMNLVSISCGGMADWFFGILRDQRVPLMAIFGIFASVGLLSRMARRRSSLRRTAASAARWAVTSMPMQR